MDRHRGGEILVGGKRYMRTFHPQPPCGPQYHDWDARPPYWTGDGRAIEMDRCRTCGMVQRMEEVKDDG